MSPIQYLNRNIAETEIHAVLDALHASHTGSEMGTFLNGTRSFAFKLRREILAFSGDMPSVAKGEKKTTF